MPRLAKKKPNGNGEPAKLDQGGSNKPEIDGNRADMFFVWPEDVVIPESGPLADPRTALPVDENLVLNVMFQGVLEPVLVRKNGQALELVAGRQRVKAAREANRRFREQGKLPIKIPAILKTGTDAEMYGIMVSENELRQDDDPMVKAEKARKLAAHGYNPAEISILFGRDKRTVEGWLALAGVAPEVQEAVRMGEVASGVGVALAELPRDQQAAKLEQLKQEGKATVKQTQREVRAESRPGRPPALPMPARKDLQGLLDKLTAEPIGEQTPQMEGFCLGLEFVLGLIPEKTALATLIPEAPKEAAQTRTEAPKEADKRPHKPTAKAA